MAWYNRWASRVLMSQLKPSLKEVEVKDDLAVISVISVISLDRIPPVKSAMWGLVYSEEHVGSSDEKSPSARLDNLTDSNLKSKPPEDPSKS